MRRTRAVLKKSLLLVFGLAIGLVVAELGLRVLRVSYPLPYAPDRVCGTRLRPNFRGWWRKEGNALIETNRFGFRHGDREPSKPKGTFRIAVLGDSFIEAFQVPYDQTVCAVMERKLAGCDALAGRPVEVLNFGVSGYGTAQELLMLRHYVWQYEPDAVVLAFFAGNDLRNNSPELEPYRVRPFFRFGDGTLTLDNAFRQHPDFLRAQSAAVRLKVALINRLRILQLINHVRTRWRRGDTAESETRHVTMGVDSAALVEPRDDAWTAAWETSERLILEVVREAEKHDAKFWLVTVPGDVQVHPDPDVTTRCQRELGVEDLLYAERRLAEFGRRHDLAVITLAEPLLHYARAHKVALHGFPNTELGFGHWNADGNRLVGEIVATVICASEISHNVPRSSQGELTRFGH
jgi:hypothetical protein